jgi:hypothetical protein
MTAATRLSDLKKNAELGMRALKDVLKLYPESSASVGESTKRLRPIGEGHGKQKSHKTSHKK